MLESSLGRQRKEPGGIQQMDSLVSPSKDANRLWLDILKYSVVASSGSLPRICNPNNTCLFTSFPHLSRHQPPAEDFHVSLHFAIIQMEQRIHFQGLPDSPAKGVPQRLDLLTPLSSRKPNRLLYQCPKEQVESPGPGAKKGRKEKTDTFRQT